MLLRSSSSSSSSSDERKYFIRTWKLIYRVYETRNSVTREMYDAEIISLEMSWVEWGDDVGL